MSKDSPFYKELILHSTLECKVTMNEQEKNKDCSFQLLTNEPEDNWSVENREMLTKIISLCGVTINEICIRTIESEMDIISSLNQPHTETVLCFGDREMIKKLHFAPSKKGFTKLQGKKIIFLPPVSLFAQNQKAKKYLWQAIQNTF